MTGPLAGYRVVELAGIGLPELKLHDVGGDIGVCYGAAPTALR